MIATERGRFPEAELARRFRQHVLADVDHLKSRGYNPTRFLGMITQHKSVVTVAKMLFANPRLTSEGFERLWEMGELNRSVEFAANLPWFSELFTEDELDEARTRLTLHDFPAEERLAVAAAHPPGLGSRPVTSTPHPPRYEGPRP
jgi:hypothetical protein